jgi:hypothetical protein
MSDFATDTACILRFVREPFRRNCHPSFRTSTHRLGSASWYLGSGGLRLWPTLLLPTFYSLTSPLFERSHGLQNNCRRSDAGTFNNQPPTHVFELYVYGARLQYSPPRSKIAAPLQLGEVVLQPNNTGKSGNPQPPWTARRSHTRSRKTGSTL